jgi:hypothetical protein
MQHAAEPVLEDRKADHCLRCLDPLPPKVPRCPGCGHPVRTLRLLPFVIGTVGLLVLVFAVLVMYRLVKNEDVENTILPPDPSTAETHELFPDPPADKGKDSEPAKAEKPPPLNER